LLFGRDASELGGLGHPAPLGEPTAGGTRAGDVEGEAPGVRRSAAPS
jgi:hypothetical protein